MTLRNLFLVNCVVAMLYGIGLLVVPGSFLATYGVVLTTGARLVAQLFGVSLIGFGLLTWFARDADESEARSAILQTLFWTDALGGLVALLGVLQGAVNVMGWSTVVVYAVLAAAFAYFLYRPAPATA
jgi:hypothetical protein